MTVETLGEAWKLGWRCTAHCLWFGPSKGTERLTPWCGTKVELEMTTLVWTRGVLFPLARLSEVLKCPRCSERKLRVMFEVRNEPVTLAKRKRPDD
jgi:hypothetical protein